MKVIFLDIDGVLNDNNYFMSNHDVVKKMYQERKYHSDDITFNVDLEMMNIDLNKLAILKDITDKTGAKVVITSSIKKKKYYSYIESKLIGFGIPIIGVTEDDISNRGTGIRHYLEEHDVSEYVILDDDIFDDYDHELLNNLIKTSFFDGGLKEEHREILIRKLIKKH